MGYTWVIFWSAITGIPTEFPFLGPKGANVPLAPHGLTYIYLTFGGGLCVLWATARKTAVGPAWAHPHGVRGIAVVALPTQFTHSYSPQFTLCGSTPNTDRLSSLYFYCQTFWQWYLCEHMHVSVMALCCCVMCIMASDCLITSNSLTVTLP